LLTSTGFYLARPYNFSLNPLSADGVELKLERNFTFSSSACDFLRKNNFDFGRIFEQGVPYLSQKEQRELEAEHRERADRAANIPEITVPANDAANLQFVRNAREEIAQWLANPKPELDYVNIGHDGIPMEVPLNAFQRRLIYQLVRKEFPACRTYPKNQQTFMRVEKVDLEKEDQVRLQMAPKM
jgi:poly(A)-specific ribonuclease